jgi:hypothetical protein
MLEMTADMLRTCPNLTLSRSVVPCQPHAALQISNFGRLVVANIADLLAFLSFYLDVCRVISAQTEAGERDEVRRPMASAPCTNHDQCIRS